MDYASATPMDPSVLHAMMPYFGDDFYNPSTTHSAGLKIRKDVETARSLVAHWLGAHSSEIVFVAGGTESNNLAIHGTMRHYPGSNAVTAATEHDSVLVPARRYECRETRVHKDGRVDLDDLSSKIDDKTVLVSIGYANNEIGTVQPIPDISRLLDEVRAKRRASENELPLYFHTDACQAANYLDLHVARLGVDMMTLDGSKIYGPKQSGCLYVKRGVVLQPLIDGGHQELGLRGGTENIAGNIGFAKALDFVQKIRRDETERMQKLQQNFLNALEETFPHMTINGSRKYRLPNNVHLTFPGQDNERLLIELDEAGIFAAAGSACNASDAGVSHVLEAIGLSETEARASIRFAMGRNTTAEEVSQTVRTLHKLIG